ncbi:hypothetical protein [Nostoc sp.]|uniref:hypothetical protein n=1 Tax=Nostoc sp. TaxID=1180 RepID=UPI002FFBA0EF
MKLTQEDIDGLSVALNEATVLGFEVSDQHRVAAATFEVLTLPEQGNPPEDSRVQFIFAPIGRIAASLRLGRWDDDTAQVVPFTIDQLLRVVQNFRGQPIYGWEFFDIHQKDFSRWADRLSVDCLWEPEGLSHSITLFQEGNDKHLDICLWFDDFIIKDPHGNQIPLANFVAGGKRWWDGLYSGDKRTEGHGIFPY